MNNNVKSILRLVIASVLSITLVFYSGYFYLFKRDIPKSDILYPETDLEHCTQDKDNGKPVNSSSVTADTENTESTESEAVETSAKGKILGKISEKFITPYTANTACDSVYLKNTTGLKIDLKELISAKLPYKIEKNDEPQVLIIHTHTTEAFLHEDRDYYTETDLPRTTDKNYSVVRLGDIITQKLNAAGIKTVHDTTLHDYPEYNGSYNRAAVTIKKNLEKYKSIKIVIDLHRDAIGGGENPKVKPVVEINGKKAAQVMLVMGSQSGYVKNFPDWEENLKLAVKLQQNMEKDYPAMPRAISFLSRLYNENLTKGSMLLEIGTDANSIDEVVYSAEMVGDSLVKTLNQIK